MLRWFAPTLPTKRKDPSPPKKKSTSDSREPTTPTPNAKQDHAMTDTQVAVKPESKPKAAKVPKQTTNPEQAKQGRKIKPIKIPQTATEEEIALTNALNTADVAGQGISIPHSHLRGMVQKVLSTISTEHGLKEDEIAYNIRSLAFATLHRATEDYITELMTKANAEHRNGETLPPGSLDRAVASDKDNNKMRLRYGEEYTEEDLVKDLAEEPEAEADDANVTDVSKDEKKSAGKKRKKSEAEGESADGTVTTKKPKSSDVKKANEPKPSKEPKEKKPKAEKTDKVAKAPKKKDKTDGAKTPAKLTKNVPAPPPVLDDKEIDNISMESEDDDDDDDDEDDE